jgi:hypothetical protein
LLCEHELLIYNQKSPKIGSLLFRDSSEWKNSSQIPTLLQAEITQGKQMRVGACEAFAYCSEKNDFTD